MLVPEEHELLAVQPLVDVLEGSLPLFAQPLKPIFVELFSLQGTIILCIFLLSPLSFRGEL
jgi:hypothetical protein